MRSPKLFPIGSKVSVSGDHVGTLVTYFLSPDFYDPTSRTRTHLMYAVVLLDNGYYTSGREMYISNINVNIDNLTLESNDDCDY